MADGTGEGVLQDVERWRMRLGKAYCRMWEDDGRDLERRIAGCGKMTEETGVSLMGGRWRWLTRLGKCLLKDEENWRTRLREGVM